MSNDTEKKINRIIADILTEIGVRVERDDPVIAASLIYLKTNQEEAEENKKNRIQQDNELLMLLEEKTAVLEKSLAVLDTMRQNIVIEAAQTAQKDVNKELFNKMTKIQKYIQCQMGIMLVLMLLVVIYLFKT